MNNIDLDYIAVGGNRHPSAADWAPGLLAFGAGNNVAVWNPDQEHSNGITALLSGHSDTVNAVRIYEDHVHTLIISGAADKSIRVWKTADQGDSGYKEVQNLSGHGGTVNTISTFPDGNLFVSGSADGIVKIWHLYDQEFRLAQSIFLKPHFLPLTTAIASLSDGAIVLATAGTSSSIQLYVRAEADEDFVLQASLRGHDGWIRSLDFTRAESDSHHDILLASASQDKFIRLWRFRRTESGISPKSNDTVDLQNVTAKQSLSNKAYQVGKPNAAYSVSFEALLIGHEDWVYTARWQHNAKAVGAVLLTASADNSLAIWNADSGSGLWVCRTRLGEISSQKGSSTATGSAGGFWIGLWQPQGQSVVSLARSGSWRRWTHNRTSDVWLPQTGISGHVREVQGLAWASSGSYLLSTSSDQTTRMYAEWKTTGRSSWHEFARPQIHGYDLNCIDAVSDDRFISGADEKLLRVFDKPKNANALLSKLSGLNVSAQSELPEAANVPVLGLSNKAVAAARDGYAVNGTTIDEDTADNGVSPELAVSSFDATEDLDHPPLEDQLSRHTLWPEHEKLYGHGYEISAVATSSDGSLVATACKASSTDHAVIRLYETREWREVRPALTAHSLTVTSMAFSTDDCYLLSVGRDRQWAIFARSGESSTTYHLAASNPKGHSRMILDCSWAPGSSDKRYFFATAGRDKSVKIWRFAEGQAECVTTISNGVSVTAVAFAPESGRDSQCLAHGDENGHIWISYLDKSMFAIVDTIRVSDSICPSSAINCLRWRPKCKENQHNLQLAVASDDCSVRIYHLPGR